MCGICGILYHDAERRVPSEILRRMCSSLVHRGPDDEGYYENGAVGMGMRRLKIIDLFTGHQPIANEEGSVWIVFNGEIYNYRELRKDLEEKGHRFTTHTDTETIVHAYEQYGDDCVTKLNGMFAFAIWDQRSRKLFAARDRLGVKPFYYYADDHCLIFGSELKALLEYRDIPKAIDVEALDAFLNFEYIPAPLSIFQDVKKLLPGHILVVENGRATTRPYWSLQFSRSEGSEEYLAEKLYYLLKDAVRMRLISDVPLGAFLSGGIDSSTIVCLMSEVMDRPVKTFSIGFDDPSYNELEYARIVANHFGTDHHELIIKPDVVDLVTKLVEHLDEPLADVSIFPTYLVSRLAQQHVTVVLSGDGGDELFAGYEWYIADELHRYYGYLPDIMRRRCLPWLVGCLPPSSKKKGVVNKVKRFVEGSALPASLRHFRWSSFLNQEAREFLYSDALKSRVSCVDSARRITNYLSVWGEADPLWQAQFADIKTYLADDILTKVDRMSMANSLETRTPFLDYRVAEFAAGVPSSLKLNGFQFKYLLKRAMASKLPAAVLNRKKEGFSIPMKNWLKQELRPMLEDVLSPSRLAAAGFFNPEYVEKLKADHLNGAANYSHQLWSLMVFEVWREAYLG